MKSRLERIMEPRLGAACTTLGWDLQRQYRLGKYTLDFLISTKSGISVCVELDGAKWHERDEEAGLHDRQRDRWVLSVCGIPTIRFLGKEILRNPLAVVTEVVQVVAREERRRLDVIENYLAVGQEVAKEHFLDRDRP